MHSQENCYVSMVATEEVKRKHRTKRGPKRAGRRVQAKRLKRLLKENACLSNPENQPCSSPIETEQNAQTSVMNNTPPPSAPSTEKLRAENSTDTHINEPQIVEDPLDSSVKVVCGLRGSNDEYL